MKHFRYFKYLVRHKWFVFIAGLRTGAPLLRLIIHDWSKFLPCEWIPYANYFYGDLPDWDHAKVFSPGYPYSGTKQGAAEAFDCAWLHHQHRNPHHWQHWVLREDSGKTSYLQMPDIFVREMVADWMGAGRAITGKWDVARWYATNREKILLNGYSRNLVELLIEKVSAGPAKEGA